MQRTMILSQLISNDQETSNSIAAALLLSRGEDSNGDIDFIVGRHSTCQFQLNNALFPGFLSRSHAKLTLSNDNKVYVTDLKSLNGTLMNNVMLEPMVKREMKIGDTVTFGCFSPDVVLTPGTTVIQDKAPFKYKLMYKDDLNLNQDANTKSDILSAHIPSLSSTPMQKPMFPLDTSTPYSPKHDHCESRSDADSGIVCHSTTSLNSNSTSTNIQDNELSIGNMKQEYQDSRKEFSTNNMNNDKLLPLTVSNLLAFSGCHFDNINFSSDEKENLEGVECTGSTGRRNLNQPKVKMKRPGKRKRRNYFTKKKNSRNQLEDSCASFECKIKNIRKNSSNMVSWVQCDFCDKWYHTDCVGCDYNVVKMKARKFQCGVC